MSETGLLVSYPAGRREILFDAFGTLRENWTLAALLATLVVGGACGSTTCAPAFTNTIIYLYDDLPGSPRSRRSPERGSCCIRWPHDEPPDRRGERRS